MNERDVISKHTVVRTGGIFCCNFLTMILDYITQNSWHSIFGSFSKRAKTISLPARWKNARLTSGLLFGRPNGHECYTGAVFGSFDFLWKTYATNYNVRDCRVIRITHPKLIAIVSPN